MPTITRHAEKRLQQRAIPSEVLNMLWEFGAVARSAAADSFYFDRKARRLLKEEYGNRGIRLFEKWLNVYAIVADDGSVITAARRTRRLLRR